MAASMIEGCVAVVEHTAVRIAGASQLAFAALLIALGVVGFALGVFSPIWQASRDLPGRDALVYICAAITLATGLGLVWQRTATIAAIVLCAALVWWFVTVRVRAVFHAPGAFGSWDSCAEGGVVIAAAWLVFARGASIHVARALYALCLISFGLGHFIYPDETAELVPTWLPVHLALAYVTGMAFVLAAGAMLVGVRAHLAAALSAAQIAVFTVLVWIPIVATGGANAFQWSEFGLSAALAVAGWVVADSYRRDDTAARRGNIAHG
jgi:uncharacterized membrane protein